MPNRIGVIGDKDSVLAFKAIGMEVFDAKDGAAAREILRNLIREEFAVIFITEQLAESNSDILARIKTNPYPAIIPIPSGEGTTGLGMRGIKQDIEKAIGADILFNREER